MANRTLVFFNHEEGARPLHCEARAGRIILTLCDLDHDGNGATRILPLEQAAVLADAIGHRWHWIGKAVNKGGIAASVITDATVLRFLDTTGSGHITLSLDQAAKLADWIKTHTTPSLAGKETR